MRVCLTLKVLINLECCLICLDFACHVVVLGNGSGETTVCWNHDECCVHLQRVSGHVLDEIPVPRCNDDCRLSVKDSSWCKQWSLHTPTSSFGGSRGMRMRKNLSKRSTFSYNLSSSRSEMASNSSGSGDLAAVIMTANGNRQASLLKAH